MPVRRLNVRPDRIDFRDLLFRPSIAVSPKRTLFPDLALRIKNQGDTNACTGFALSLVAEARRRWGLGSRPMDVCVYAHGGLVDEDAAAGSAAAWIQRLYENRIFPIYLMWETGLLATIVNRVVDALRDVPRPAGAGVFSSAERWWNERVERLLAMPGSALWGELKQNAHAISQTTGSGGVLLWSQLAKLERRKHPMRLHLAGHSAGSVVHAHLIDALAAKTGFESVSFLAPSLRLDTFDALVRPRIGAGTIKRYQQFHLTDKAEQDDPTCGPYRRSLLYLVSESFEGGARTPLVGLQKYFDPYRAELANTTVQVSPGATSTSSTHSGFDDDEATRSRVVEFIKSA